MALYTDAEARPLGAGQQAPNGSVIDADLAALIGRIPGVIDTNIGTRPPTGLA